MAYFCCKLRVYFLSKHGRHVVRLHRRRRATHPRAIPLAMITIRKSVHGFPSALLSIYGMGMGLRLAAFGYQSSTINKSEDTVPRQKLLS